jgi:hypothetical protein
MAYKITSISTKPNVSVPNFAEWIGTVPESAIAAFPDAAGKTPLQVILDSVAELDDPAKGFISQGTTVNDNLSWTWESIWTSQDDWQSTASNNSYINGNITQGELAGEYLRKLYLSENGITVETFFSNI